MYYGFELFFPEDSPWAWLRILDEPSLADPEAITSKAMFTSGDLLRSYEKRTGVPLLVVWKSTGNIFRMVGGAVEDDPIFEYEADR